MCVFSPVFAFVCLFTSNLKFIVTGLRFVHTIFYHSNKFVYTILHTKNEKMKTRTGSRMLTETMRKEREREKKKLVTE